ncbi:unnamed protein product [Ceutorhynchus assimilis]|uniref:SWIM-type domain-containing protein n=1 Tax=Ceutorhynchus assimilis TaxID=467358 RepID=A0A9N9QAP3_9CUCU|nr:unnamed protein product [Ceutorhynchus assimilis]
MWGKDLSAFRKFNFGVALLFFESHGYKKRQEDRGFKFFKEGYIHEVMTQALSIKAQCYRSMKKHLPPHKLHITLFENGENIRETHCSCGVGNSESCHHVVTLAYFMHEHVYSGLTVITEDVSCTSKPMECNKRRGKKIEPEQIGSSIFYNPNNVNREKDPIKSTFRIPFKNLQLMDVKNSDVENLKQVICGCGNGNYNCLFPTFGDNAQDSIEVLDGITRASRNSVLGQRNFRKDDIMSDEPREELPITLPVHCSEIENILISVPNIQF